MSEKKMSVLSSFIKSRIKDKGWSVRKFAEEADLGESYCYELVSSKRDFTPNDDTLNKVGDTLGLDDGDRKYILEIAARERETGEIVYEEDEDEETGNGESGDGGVPWFHRKVLVALFVGFLVGSLMTCCIMSVFGSVILESLPYP